MRYWTPAFALFIGIMGSSIAFQKPPNLAGHWVLDPRPAPNEEAGPVCGLECNITQDAKVLTVIVRGSPLTQIFKLDGSPDTETRTSGNYSTQLSHTARWEGETLVITRQTGPVGGSPTIETTTRLSLNNERLVIVRKGTIKGADGSKQPYDARSEGKPFVYKLVK
jgi:hypothetical protein